MRILVLVFGGTTLATSTVLAVFMGGLALGSFLAARYSNQIARPFLWYGILEGGIGAWAIVAPLLFSLATPIYQMSWQQFHMNPFAFNLVRFVVAAVILLPPTTCMGATLPLLSKMIATSMEKLGDRIGLLYSVNTFGAVAGTALAGFFLLPMFGMTVATACAAAINFFLLAAVLIVDKKIGTSADNLSAAAPTAAAQTAAAQTAASPTAASGEANKVDASERPAQSSDVHVSGSMDMDMTTKLCILLFGVAGGISMIYEVAWTRALLLVIGSSTYAFSVMVAAFLLGIVGGSYFCSRLIDKRGQPLAWLAVLELCAGMTAFIGLTAFNLLPYWGLQLSAWLHPDSSLLIVLRFVMAAVVLMPLTFCVGATFPAAVKACTKQLEEVGRSVGTIYSVNTIGCILGALVAGFLLIPAVGAESTLVIAAMSNIAIGAAFLCIAPIVRPSIRILVAGCAAVLLLCWGALPKFWDNQILVFSQTARRFVVHGGPAFNLQSFEKWSDGLHRQSKMLYFADGGSSNVAVLKNSESGLISLITNGHVDASDGVDMSVQQLLGYLPVMAVPDAKEAAVVGWGSGVTVGSALQGPVKHIDAIELEPLVIEAAQNFNHVNHQPDKDPRVTIVENDGRNHLLATNTRYDLIMSEPSNPWQAGVCNLFTREYFEVCKKSLSDRGVFALWVQLTELPPENIKQIASAVTSVFPHTLTFLANQGNMIVLASKEPITMDWNYLNQIFAKKGVVADLTGIQAASPSAIAGRMICSDAGLRALAADAPANTDDRNRLEYEVGRVYEADRIYQNDNIAMLSEHMPGVEQQVNFGKVTPQARAEMLADIASSVDFHNTNMAMYWIKQSLQVPTSEGYRVLGMLYSVKGDLAKARAAWNEALRINPKDALTYETRGNVLAANNMMDEARADYQKLIELRPDYKDARAGLARIYAPKYLGVSYEPSQLDAPKVLAILGDLPKDKEFTEHLPIVLLLNAEAHLKLGHIAEAEQSAKQYMTLVPKSIAGSRLLAYIETAKGNRQAAAAYFEQSVELARKPDGAPSLIKQAKQQIESKNFGEARKLLNVAVEYDPGNKQAQQMLHDAGGP